MPKEYNKGKDYSLSIVAVVGIVVTGLTICFLATQGFNFNGSVEKEKIEVTAYNSNLIEK